MNAGILIAKDDSEHFQETANGIICLTAVEDFSGMIVIFMLAKRSEQWECLAHLLTWSFTQTGQKVKMIRADGEWITPQRVKNLQSIWGFEIKATNADTPQQNGYVEGVGSINLYQARKK